MLSLTQARSCVCVLPLSPSSFPPPVVMTEVAPVAGVSAITYHAWNADRSLVALSPNTNEVWIYGAKGEDASKWEKKWTLDEHAGQVSGIDWCPTTNLIVTCGHDRNAYVWKVSSSSTTHGQRAQSSRTVTVERGTTEQSTTQQRWAFFRFDGSLSSSPLCV